MGAAKHTFGIELMSMARQLPNFRTCVQHDRWLEQKSWLIYISTKTFVNIYPGVWANRPNPLKPQHFLGVHIGAYASLPKGAMMGGKGFSCFFCSPDHIPDLKVQIAS